MGNGSHTPEVALLVQVCNVNFELTDADRTVIMDRCVALEDEPDVPSKVISQIERACVVMGLFQLAASGLVDLTIKDGELAFCQNDLGCKVAEELERILDFDRRPCRLCNLEGRPLPPPEARAQCEVCGGKGWITQRQMMAYEAFTNSLKSDERAAGPEL